MHKHGRAFVLGTLTVTLLIPSTAFSQDAREVRKSDPVEEIYIVRSVRESRIAPTPFCDRAKTGFEAFAEDRFTFRSTTTSATDGRMTDADVKEVGSGRGCLGQNADHSVLGFYLETTLDSTVLKGIGDCRRGRSDFPERGITEWHCYLELSDPAGQYVGGQLASSTIASLTPVGRATDPPGYTQPSIATIRLWRKRSAQ